MSRSISRMLIVCIAGAFIPLSFAWGGDFERGKMLYENQCRDCHESTGHFESESRFTGWIPAWLIILNPVVIRGERVQRAGTSQHWHG